MLKRNFYKHLLLLIGISFSLTQVSYAQANINKDTVRVLFIGNSYTSTHNIPKIFSDLAKANNINIEVESLVYGGAKFQDHLLNQSTSTKLSEKNWNYVILQEQSQMMAFGDSQVRQDSIEPAKKLVHLIHNNAKNAKIIFYNTWGRKNGDQANCKNLPELCTYDGMQQRIDKNYIALATETNSMLAPIGKAWKQFGQKYPNLELYQPDGSHPSEIGAYLAAYSFYRGIFYSSSGNLDVTNLDKNTMLLIRNLVDRVIK